MKRLVFLAGRADRGLPFPSDGHDVEESVSLSPEFMSDKEI